MKKRTDWEAIKALTPMSNKAQAAYDDEQRTAEFRAFVHRLRTDSGLTQAELALRMGTTQSAIARMEGGGVRPTLETLEKLAKAIGSDLVVGVGEDLADKAGIKTMVRSGHAVVRSASRTGNTRRQSPTLALASPETYIQQQATRPTRND